MTERVLAKNALPGCTGSAGETQSSPESGAAANSAATSFFPEPYVIKAFSELSRETVQRRWQALNVIVRMSMLAGLKLELDAALDLAFDYVGEIVSFDCGLAFFWEQDREQLKLRLTRQMEPPTQERLGCADLLTTWARKYEGPLLIQHGCNSEIDTFLESVSAKSVLVLPLFAGARVLGCLQLFSSARDRFTEEDARLLWMLSLMAEKLFQRDHADKALVSLAFTDFLTGLKSRRYFEEQLDRELKRAERSGSPLSVALIDIDHFKAINDTYGHKAGDVILREVSARLVKGMREIDTVARYGGEEFVLILPDTNFVGADHVAQRLRSDIESTAFSPSPGSNPVQLTISVGVAAFPRDAKLKEGLIEAADAALYEAKRTGRNRVVLYSELDFAAGRRLEQRFTIALPVRIWGLDINGQMFEQDAVTIDITTTGARLLGISHQLQKGCIVGIQHKTSKARYRVTWVGKQGTAGENQIGLRLVDTGKLIWGRVIQRIFGDDFGRGESRKSPLSGLPPSEVVPISRGNLGKPLAEVDSKRAGLDESSSYRCSGSISFRQQGVARPVHGLVSDISLSGCKVELSPDIVKGTEVSVLLNVGGTRIRAKGEFRDSQAAVGVQLVFKQMSEADRAALQELIIRLERLDR